MKKKIGSSKSVKKYQGGGGTTDTIPPRRPQGPAGDKPVPKAGSGIYKKGGSVGAKPKMKMGGSCGTPKSLSKRK